MEVDAIATSTSFGDELKLELGGFVNVAEDEGCSVSVKAAIRVD